MIKLIKTETITDEFHFPVKRQFFLHPDGSTHRRDLIEHPGAVMIVPMLDPKTFVMIRQYRHAIQQELYEFPAGTLEAGEDLLFCAQRELQEEVGYRAEVIDSLGYIYPTPGFCNEVIHCYLAKDLKPSSLSLDDGEIIESCEVNVTQLEELITNNQLVDSKSLAVYAKIKALGII